MAKTKMTGKTMPSSSQKDMDLACVHCMHRGDMGRCWLCWLFKSLIVLFSAFLVLWMGFYLGLASARPFSYQIDPALKSMLEQRKNCQSMSTGMDHDMSGMSMDMMMNDMTNALKDKQGAAFDNEFLLQMIVHHEGAVEMAKMVLEKSENAELRKFAQQIIDVQSKEIDQMKAWQAAWKK